MLARKWNCAFLPAQPTRQLGEVRGFRESWSGTRKALKKEIGREPRHRANLEWQWVQSA